MDFWKSLKETDNFTVTENGAVAYKSTFNACLDAFGSLGAMRRCNDTAIVSTFENAFNEDKVLAMRMLFWLRDIRGGIGERRAFRIILKWLVERHPEYVLKNLHNILEYGRGDDYLCLLDTQLRNEVATYLKNVVEHDLNNLPFKHITLTGKWLPSINTSSAETKRYANILAKAWGWSPRRYRRTLSTLRRYLDITETKMSAQEWKSIDYEKVPAKAAMNYSDAFFKHDEFGYTCYLQKIASGEVKTKSETLYPSEIVHRIMSSRKRISVKDVIYYDALWNNLPNYFEKAPDESSICVVDVSGSMSGEPMEVAVALGMYCADKCRGPFHNKFITFSSKPQLVEIKGDNLVDKVNNISRADWGANTDIEAVFNLILATAIQNNCKQEDLPNKLYIISDMQFDEASGGGSYYDYRHYSWVQNAKSMSFMQRMRQRYAEAGYEMPALVYWNVRASTCGMFQETRDGENIAMVSGYSAKLFESVIEGTTYEEVVNERGETVTKQKIDPMTVMLTTLGNERYDNVWVG